MKPNINKIIKTVKTTTSKHSPEILTAIGIAGMVTTVVLAVQATPKALKKIDKEIDRKNEELIRDSKEKGETNCVQISKLSPVETVKAAWKPYIPAAITCVTSIACLIGANTVHAKRNAALATACQLSATALNDFKEKVHETVDEETEKIINDKVAKEQVKKNPVSNVSEPVILESGNYLCYDAGGNKYFRSDENTIREAINELNASMNMGEPYVSLNDLYYKLGVRGTDVGELLGWNLYRDGLISPQFSSQVADNGEPCIVIGYLVAPRYDYHKYD